MIAGSEIQNKARSYFKYIFALLLFGSNGIVASLIPMSSYEIVLLRTLLGSFLLLALFALGKGKFTFYEHKKHSLYLAVSGVVMGTSWMLLYEAYARIGVGISSLLYYCGPVIVMALSPVLFREKLDAYKVSGFLAVLCGVFLVNGNAWSGGGDTFGIACGALSAVMYAFMVIFNKKATAITGLENATLQLTVSFLTVAVFTGVKQGFVMDIPAGSVLPLLILGFLNTGVGCYFYFSSIGSLPVQSVAICGYLEPLSAVVLSVLILRETMLPMQIVGAVLILGGAIFGECVKREDAKE